MYIHVYVTMINKKEATKLREQGWVYRRVWMKEREKRFDIILS